MKWHQGEKWETLLSVYDGIAREQFGDGMSKIIPTHFGDTQVHCQGDPSKSPLVFFHGVSSNSLMFGEWLTPELSKDYYTICIDTIGDMGRSCPRDHNPSNGPQNCKEVGEWAMSVFEQLDIIQPDKRIDIVGYSLGSYIATCVAREHPERIGRIILLCPAGVVAPVRKLWLFQAIAFAICSSVLPRDSNLANKLKTWFFGSMMANPSSMKNLKYPELREAIDAVGSPQVKFQPETVPVDVLTEMVKSSPTLLVIGQQESVIDPVEAIANAKRVGMKVKAYDQAGHMLFCEHPREEVIDEIRAFMLR